MPPKKPPPTTPTPPEILNAPVVVELTLDVLEIITTLVVVTFPPTAVNVKSPFELATVAAPLPTVTVPPTFKLPPIPAPPTTCSAPVFVDEEVVIPANVKVF